MGIALNLVALEILAVNLFTTHQCSKNRFATGWILLTFMGFTVLVIGLNQGILTPLLPNLLNGEGLYLLMGLLYFIPLYFVYDQPFKRTGLVMFTAWIYTTFIYGLSGLAVDAFSLASNTSFLLVQTGLFACTYVFFHGFIRKRFLYVLFNADGTTVSTSLVLSVLWFLVVWLLNIDLHYTSLLLDLSILVIVAVSILLTYTVFHTLTLAEESKKAMTSLTLHDELTGLRNREALRKDMMALLQKALPFTVVFMDLDRFKSVNDEYGHAEGDEYLRNFARTIEGMYKELGNLYRMSGDEFVLIHTSPENTKLCREIERFDFKGDPGRAFLGVSVGCAHYPDDATTVSELLHIADTNMYQVKKRRHAEQGAPSKD